MHKLLISTSILLCTAGIALAAPLGVSWLEQRQAVNAAPQTGIIVAQQPLVDVPGVVKGIPRHITVQSLGINVDVSDGSYNAKNGEWTLSDDAAFYATITNPANSDSGNTFIYGHATNKIFGNLARIKKATEVTVTTDNGYAFTYVYSSRETIKPTDTIVLEYSGKPRLTLQTCSGIWSETREIFYFDLKDYHKL